MFISIYAHIPLIIVGIPGISKSLSNQLFIKNIFSEQNDSYFLKNFPKNNTKLISEKNMLEFLNNIIKNEIELMNNKNFVKYFGSPLKGDKMDISYNKEMMLNIEKSISEGKIIILIDLEQINSVFYYLLEQNYIIKDGIKVLQNLLWN